MSDDPPLFPFAIYDTRASAMAHLGLYQSADDCWRIFLGWPTKAEVEHAKNDGLVCLAVTCSYDPGKPIL